MNMKDKPTPKIGTGHGEAMLRQGLAELRGALYPESNVAQPPQYGLYGTRTPGEVAQAREADAEQSARIHDLDEEPKSILDERMRQAEAQRDDRGREDKDRGPEKG